MTFLRQPLKPHFPCGIQPAVTNLEVFPRIGWASLMPDATGVVDLTVKGSPLAFRGRGYHDKVRAKVQTKKMKRSADPELELV